MKDQKDKNIQDNKFPKRPEEIIKRKPRQKNPPNAIRVQRGEN
jgi:hypothetical protein